MFATFSSILTALLFAAFLALIIVFAVKRRAEQDHAHCESGMNRSEKRVAVLFDKALGEDARIINNLILPGVRDERQTTQIDTILICRKGIFVVETKSWNGKVYGYREQKHWTVYYRRESHRQYNPVWQNEGHANRIRQLMEREGILSAGKVKIIPMVVFFHGDIRHARLKECFKPYEVAGYANSFQNVLSAEEADALWRFFRKYKDDPVCTNEEHIYHIKERWRE